MHVRAWKDREQMELISGDDSNFSDGPYIEIHVDQVNYLIETLKEAKKFVKGQATYCSFKVKEAK